MRTRNLIHLQITNHKAMRLLLYIPREKLTWYDEQDRHQSVLDILKPIIHRYLLIDQDKTTSKQKKAMESAKVISQDTFQIVYQFVPYITQETMLTREHRIMLENNGQDALPTKRTSFSPLAIYGFQLLVSLADPDVNTNTSSLDNYFSVAS
ncbi:hypothetical protein PHYBLDRAFT_141683 [Phycomyces blakesleeanus NRRL 1555(-)]|uniref:Uncharacterized protein n=1 Tax=Phycomyces blakesleeanus (strain ATCC 8743b / DSM 1359 / FGSC 10004 / NBRC 33097 / NRRL 1555) TaxID=763407 RepID=A0A162UST5_PHYB8|nr:hypothetical protein PHYBLDRAFT_141683 [Phycomyces blakesleeanus NRRL 1555(-)]OAD77822.1 hypothetical protein PHYBLDRAFT_141683 [Phycomyces blakesleeanus NRRL 1555(-)]|eukprot:XP_018295862.1 hypothetical protein PHYBLDRAFT_141683 [Phycomyces blakesleeanus NRRL 1555(-)]